MSKKLFTTLLIWSIIFVPLSHLCVAQNPPTQGQQKDKKKDEKKKDEKGGILGGIKRGVTKAADKTVEVAKDPQKAIDQVKAWAAGGNRKWTDEQKREANEAQALFSAQDLRQINSSSLANAGPIYDPTNTAAAQAMMARADAVGLKYKGRSRLTAAQAQEVSNAIMPFSRAANALHLDSRYFQPTSIKPDSTGSITIPAHTEVSMGLRVNCEDIGASAPQSGEKMHLVPESTLLPDEFVPIFVKLAAYSQNHPEAQAQIQRIVWNMRHGCFRDWEQGKALRLQPADNALLDELSPGASKIISDKCHKFNVANFSKDVLAASLNGGARIDVNPVGLIDANQTTLRVVNAHAHIPITEPIPNDNSDFSLIAPGVAVQSHNENAGAVTSKITVRNTTDKNVKFTPSEWGMESRRPTQRFAIVGISPGEAIIIAGVVILAIIAATRGLLPLLMGALARGLIADGEVAAFLGRSAEALATAGRTLEEILMPGGEMIGQAGAKFGYREVQGGIPEARAMFDELTRGGQVISDSTYKGTLIRMPNGGTIGFRTQMTASPNTAATIDVNMNGIAIKAIKFNP
ncbi:MAG: hypothetical protein QOH41_760 [Blastocatellia bacterium]|jgi:hypothetical protein|nr:hypothetical protein [Blastocatellia bacterium]